MAARRLPRRFRGLFDLPLFIFTAIAVAGLSSYHQGRSSDAPAEAAFGATNIISPGVEARRFLVLPPRAFCLAPGGGRRPRRRGSISSSGRSITRTLCLLLGARLGEPHHHHQPRIKCERRDHGGLPRRIRSITSASSSRNAAKSISTPLAGRLPPHPTLPLARALGLAARPPRLRASDSP